MNAVCANDADDNGADRADNVTGVEEGVRHRQNARSERSFQQVDHRVIVTAIK